MLAFLGMNPTLVRNIDLNPTNAATRESRIRTQEAALRSILAGKGPRTPDVALGLLSLYGSQALYLDQTMAFNKPDANFPNPQHFLKAYHGKMIVIGRWLLREFPAHQQIKEWEAQVLISRLNLGELAAFDESKKFVEKNAKLGPATRTRLAALAFAYKNKNKQQGDFTDVKATLQLPMDHVSKAVLSMLQAENFVKKGAIEQARDQYVECIKYGRISEIPTGGPLIGRCLGRLVDVSLASGPRVLDPKVIEFLLHFRDFERARYYAESVAINNRETKPETAQRMYEDALQYSSIPDATTLKMATRMLDFALLSTNATAIEKRLYAATKVLKETQVASIGFEDRLPSIHYKLKKLSDQDAAPKKANEPDTALKNATIFVRVHDFLRKEFDSYAKNDDWEVSLLNTLKNVESHKLASERADAFGKKANTAEGKLTATRFSVNSRIVVLGLPATPDWNPKRKLNANTDTTNSFIEAAIQLSQASVPESEAENASALAIYAAVLSKQSEKASTIFEESSKKFPTGKHTPEAASFLINSATNHNDEIEKEKVLRIVVNAKIVPSAANHKSPRAMLEDSMWNRAEKFGNENQLENAATTYVAFQQEFPASRRAASALRKATDVSLADKKTDKAISYLEALLENYPRSDLAMEARWQAGTLAESLEQKERAADHFALFAQKYPGEGLGRNAWFRAASLYEKSGNTDKAVQAYESFVAQAPSPKQKIDGLQAEVRLLRSKGQTESALIVLNRIGESAKGLSGDKIEEVSLDAQLQSLELLKEAGRHAEAQKLAIAMTSSRPRSELGLISVARANFILGEYRMELMRERLAAPNFIVVYDKIMELYSNTQNALLNICEVPNQAWCSAGYFEASMLAQRVNQAFTAALPVAPTDGADPIRDAVLAHITSLEREASVYAEKAIDTVATLGAPNEAYRKKISKLNVPAPQVPVKETQKSSEPATQQVAPTATEPPAALSETASASVAPIAAPADAATPAAEPATSPAEPATSPAEAAPAEAIAAPAEAIAAPAEAIAAPAEAIAAPAEPAATPDTQVVPPN